MAPTIAVHIKDHILPGLLILAGIAYLLWAAVTTPRVLLEDFKALRNRAFTKLWLVVGKDFAKTTPPALDPILSSCRGLILDVGPGSGDQVFRFAKSKDVSAIYGAEPNINMHSTLERSAREAQLSGKYKILSCGAEERTLVPALEAEGLLKRRSGTNDGIFDEIVCIRVLCGVPELKRTVDGLYRYLKPGGRLVVCEHVISSSSQGGSKLARLLQEFYMMLGWSFWLDGCCLTRDTGKVVKEAAAADGGWQEVKVETANNWSVIPHIIGYYVKKA
ncbi:hypothetical protein BP6252_13663 [Coleophoma cylindrospora]|uniref:S-adenosyl-L-methionine-dependent methyltransferase n=1 Tax=Coleophoma cylindrospora TaxID=1849047 RepID=A0A3D8Q8T6_9HELO|nr:hypothetical protein BP6252_13663 [Coleophoma cylindrospora]